MKRELDIRVQLPGKLREKIIRMAHLNGMTPSRFLKVGIRSQLEALESGRLKTEESADHEEKNA